MRRGGLRVVLLLRVGRGGWLVVLLGLGRVRGLGVGRRGGGGVGRGLGGVLLLVLWVWGSSCFRSLVSSRYTQRRREYVPCCCCC